MIVHASTSAVNPVRWNEVMEYLMEYWQRSPYESRVFNPNVGFYQSKGVYDIAFKVTRKIPAMTAYHLAKVFGSKKTRADMT